MIERLRKLVTITILATIVSCTSTTEETTIYLGGKIINPKNDHVILFHNEVAIDTFSLDERNKFLGKVSSDKEGLYYFKHGNEFQYLYLEPRDSILLRLNTWDFDESLVFSGKGSERNNMLIDCFLDTERESRLFNVYYNFDPKAFKVKIDSIIALKLKRYQEFETKNPEESKSYLNILKIALTYPVYGHVENYPMIHREKKHDFDHQEINDEFYSYRKNLSTNQDSIIFYSPYRNLIVNHIYNKVYSGGHKMGSDEFAIGLLNTISEDINNDSFKNRMLRQTILRHFYRRSTCQYNPDTFKTYLALSSDKEDKELVLNLINDTKKLHVGKKLSNFHITDYNHTDRSIKSVIKGKNTFVYFWNPRYSSKEYISTRIKYLSREFPKTKFIIVKINGKGKDRIKKLDIKDQFYISSENTANMFLTSKMPRALIISKKGVLMNGYASLSSNNTYDQLKELSGN